MKHHLLIKSVVAFNFIYFLNIPVKAQIIPDQSVNTVITPSTTNGLTGERIDGGTIRGTNLFHSFQESNVEAGRGTYFANPTGITNILTRVTGTNSSKIMGTLGVLGNANLFIINPNGIVFGSNAILDLNGSFLASTASSINLADGTQFSSNNPQTVPLLTVSVPTGLNFRGNSGSIQVQGTGHNLSNVEGFTFFTAITGAGASTTGLRVQAGNTVALVGGDTNFEGGIISAPSGRIEIGSVGVGQVKIDSSLGRLVLDYTEAQTFQDIQLARLTLLNISGAGGGDIHLQGRRISISDGSFALSQNQGLEPAGTIRVKATELLDITGTTSSPIFRSPSNSTQLRAGLLSETLRGKGANIYVSAKDLIVESSGGIVTVSLLSGTGGDILLNASNNIQVIGFSPVDPINNFSVIASTGFGSGKVGNILISANSLSIQDGANVSSGTFNTGSGGNVEVNTLRAIDLNGVNPVSFVPSILGAGTVGSGPGGKITINTGRLTVLNGARVDSSTLSSGTAGSVEINARELVEVSGFIPGVINPSLISSSANTVEPSLQNLFGLPAEPTGSAGSVAITTNKLVVNNGALVNVRNDGRGNAGTLKITANSIKINNQGSITAATTSGEGGFITIETQDLQLRRNSSITADTGGTGNARNLTITTDTLTALENSNITANASQGKGGNVQINTQGLFQSLDSNITADSELGIDGTVQINTPDIDPSRGLVELPSEVVDASKLIAQGCPAGVQSGASKFVVTGRGGLTENPNETLDSDAVQIDLVEPAPESITQPSNSNVTAKLPKSQNIEKVLPAQGWVFNNKGEVTLVAYNPNSAIYQAPQQNNAVSCP